MLDEPLAGLSAPEARQLSDLVVELSADGLTIVLVEHNLGEVTRIARRLVVMHNGGILAQGPPGGVMARADVREAYLGAAHA
jgi:branched-chain amino acid transport system ATP-binding protein